MSIIEKALDKMDRAPVQPRPPRPRAGSESAGAAPATRPRDTEPRPAAQPAGNDGSQVPETTGRRTSAEVVINLESLKEAGIVTPDSANTLLGEQHRLLKRPLLKRADPASPQHVRNGNLIVVTSALPGEGKTFLSLNLAMSIAMEIDQTVMLVDADSAKSNISSVLGLGPREGLTDLLVNPKLSVADVLLKTNVPKLTVLPSGPHHPKTTELFASDEMRRLVGEIAERYDDRIVIFDSPPLLATSGTSVLAGLMGQVVFVVEAERTLHRNVQDALKLIEHCEHVGLVFNKSRERLQSRYGYGYGYGYYGA